MFIVLKFLVQFQVNGERLPGDVYKDFKDAVFKILGKQDNPPVFSNGKVAPIPDDLATTDLPTVVSEKYNYHLLY